MVGNRGAHRLREQNQRLRTLLDDVDDSAALFESGRRILYNLPAFQGLAQAPRRSPRRDHRPYAAELGVPAELVIAPIEDLLPLARGHESFEATAWAARRKPLRCRLSVRRNRQRRRARGRDIHNRELAETRLDLLTKLSTLAGMMDTKRSPRPGPGPDSRVRRLVAVTFVEGKRIRRTFLAHRDPLEGAAARRDHA